MSLMIGPNFLKAATQRLTAAQALLDMMFALDARYLGGYAIECSLKALIMGLTPESERDKQFMRISRGYRMHQHDTLRGILDCEFRLKLPPDLIRRLRRFDWSTDLRYETGRSDIGETRGLLKTSKAVYDWAEEKLQ